MFVQFVFKIDHSSITPFSTRFVVTEFLIKVITKFAHCVKCVINIFQNLPKIIKGLKSCFKFCDLQASLLYLTYASFTFSSVMGIFINKKNINKKIYSIKPWHSKSFFVIKNKEAMTSFELGMRFLFLISQL